MNHSLSEGGPMKNEITMRWIAVAPLALLAVAMFSEWR